jgi:hypothetical protein
MCDVCTNVNQNDRTQSSSEAFYLLHFVRAKRTARGYSPPHREGLAYSNYQRAVMVGQQVRGGGKGGGRLRLCSKMDPAMAS